MNEKEKAAIESFEKRTIHSIRCKDAVWSIAREASREAGCSYSVFAEFALLLLARLVKEHRIAFKEYDDLGRWLEEKVEREGLESVASCSSARS